MKRTVVGQLKHFFGSSQQMTWERNGLVCPVKRKLEKLATNLHKKERISSMKGERARPKMLHS